MAALMHTVTTQYSHLYWRGTMFSLILASKLVTNVSCSILDYIQFQLN